MTQRRGSEDTRRVGATADMSSTQTRARTSLSPESSADRALRLAKERASTAEKRADLATVRAADLERRVKDKDAHIQMLQDELVHYTTLSTTASATAHASARAASRELGYRGAAASASGGSSTARDSTIRRLAERLRRGELHADRHAKALEDRAERAEARAAKAEKLLAAASRTARGAGRGETGKAAAAFERERFFRLAEDLEALRAYVARAHGVCHGSVTDGGDAYEGFLRSARPEVFGRCAYECGDVYVGEWRDGKPHGFGECRFFETGCAYEGFWREGGYHGPGKYTYRTGETFEGAWENDRRHGPGVFRDAAGTKTRAETYVRGEPTSSGDAAGDDAGENDASSADARRSAAGEAEMRAMRASLRDRYDARWRSFEETFLRKEGAKTIDWHDVPWPPAGVPLVLVDRGEATSDAAAKLAEERKRRCVEETKRWHPDKWVGKPLAPRARDQIMAEVTNVFRRVDAEKQKAGL